MGIVVVVAWFLVVGPLGALLLGGIAYSMFADNLEAGLICGFFFFSPLLLTLAWGARRLYEVSSKNRAHRALLMLTTRPTKAATRSFEN